MTTLYDAKNNKIGIIDSFDVLNGNLLEIVLINGCTMHFAPGDIIRDDPYGWHIRYGGYDRVPCKRSRQSAERAKKNDIVQFGMCRVCIRKVIFNDPATIVFWSDGTKTVVKCCPEDTYDMEKGLAMAIVKKMAGNDNRFHKAFKQWYKPKKENKADTAARAMAKLARAAAKVTESVNRLADIAAGKAERGE